MTSSRARMKDDGAILLGDHISCDGFAYDCPVRVQTHIHMDHMVDFETSKANQTIIMSPDTRNLLCAQYNADLPYRRNIKAILPGQAYEVNNDLVELYPSNHMLGSVQVQVTCADGYKVGYSSDFFWPLDHIIEVDELVIDATYGDPLRVRQYSQQVVDEKLISMVAKHLRSGKSTAVIAHNGRLQYALYTCGNIIDVPVICSPKAYSLVDVYRQHGYPLPNVLRSDSADAINLLRRKEPVIAFVTLSERRHLPWVDRFPKVTLSAFASKMDDPVVLYDNGDCCIALTDHADFEGTLEYVSATGARTVWTDPRSGNAASLAQEISARLGVQSDVIPKLHSRGWG